jgi:UPF0042 nucleotide-binding protein
MSTLTVLVVTGMSGAGRSTVLDALEDIGYYCVDNLPPAVIQNVVKTCQQGGIHRVALGLDVRVRGFLEAAVGEVRAVRQSGEAEVRVVFLDATDETLVRRFSSTRRPHPLSTFSEGLATGPTALLAGVGKERERLSGLRTLVSEVIDTTQLSVHDLRRIVAERYGTAASTRMHTRIMSFGFKFGPPVEADLVLDVRFIENPYFVESLKAFTGLDPAVRDFVLQKADCQGFVERALELLVFALPRYVREGKSYLTVAIGCTGGRHRSVAIAEHIAERLRQDQGMQLEVVHRDIER